MISPIERFGGARRLPMLVATMLAVSLAAAPSASAAEHHPTGAFAPFVDCPLSNAAVEQCVLSHTTSGEFTIGRKTVPIGTTVTLQGGTTENPETGALTFVGAEDGNTLSNTALPVPGGLLGVVAPEFLPEGARQLFDEIIEKGPTGVTATAELAAPAGSIGLNTQHLLFGEGTALSLPLKIKLSNPFLGEDCYIGSDADPVTIELTTGTTNPPAPNKPIKGDPGKLEIEEEGALVLIKDNSLVNNSFAAPEAEGCGGLLSAVVDPAVDAEIGLPAAAGSNTAILNGQIEQAAAAAVRGSE
jgi:hypothetical protein